MNLNEVKIVADSSADLIAMEGIAFENAPLKVITDEKEFVDNADLDIDEMVNHLLEYKGKSKSSCPAPDDWLSAFGDAKYVFCVAITSGLSGSFNSACVAKGMYEEAHPDRKVFVIDSLSAGPELTLIAEKLRELVLAGNEFEAVCKQITEYCKKTGLFFMLESLVNFANNGRISPIVAKAVGILGIRMVGKASDAGQLQPLDKCRGERKALDAIVKHLAEAGLQKGRVILHHCLNLGAAESLSSAIKSAFPKVDVTIGICRGLCSFYAEKGGLLVGYERF